MLERLFLAAMATFSLNLFLGANLTAETQTASSPQQIETPKILVKLQKQEQVFRQKVLSSSVDSYKAPTSKIILQLHSLFDGKSN